jgi:hypothetical protein
MRRKLLSISLATLRLVIGPVIGALVAALLVKAGYVDWVVTALLPFIGSYAKTQS